MTRFVGFIFTALICLSCASAATTTTHKTKKKDTARPALATTATRAKAKPRSKAAAALRVAARASVGTPLKAMTRRVRRSVSPWDVPTYADSTIGDVIDGEDLQVRRAAVDALGPFNGAVVVADPTTGRILSMVNQKLALEGAYQPCSTIKLVASLAALSEGMIDKDTRLRLSGRVTMDLTTAIARSNNVYFANLGEKLGFDKIYHYGKLYGLGEKAGYDLTGESPGIFPDKKPREIPVGMMTSFGEAIGITPLQLAALVSSIANGGTLYYLQYPRNEAEIENFAPRVKRFLDIRAAVPMMKPGMLGATDFGTARRASYDPNEPIFGKTGTCSDARTHLGWFGSFNEVGGRKLVVVVLLTGGRGINGPVASGVAGLVYKNLSQQQYFARGTSAALTVAPAGR
ncbi:MAG: penicillin-binding transpeptidase domain-containing protein [Bryobacteraceae bacterium]|jgi:cell division protein FtsI/penicillin-binding protein 2